jgi:hypothetical protein
MTEPSSPVLPHPVVDPATAESVSRVDAARARLAELEGTPVGGHVPVFDEVHDVLQSTLAGLDER